MSNHGGPPRILNTPAHIDEFASNSAGPWSLDRLEPSDLLIMWPASSGPDAPTLEQCLAALQHHLGEPVSLAGQPSIDDPRIEWNAVVHAPGKRELILWAEPMRPLPDNALQNLKSQNVRWLVGMETLLNPVDPLSDFTHLLKTAARSFPHSPAILNVNTECWHTRQELDESIFAGDIGPGASILWIVHAIGADPDPGSIAWVYTRGLSRCGVPELEMVGVPVSRARPAAALLGNVAELVLEQGIPEPGAALEIGSDLEVTFQPWRDIAATISPKAMGSLNQRHGHDGQPLTGARAAVCDAEPVDGQWRWPEEVIERLRGDEPIAVYQSRHATMRQAKLAQATWDDFARAFVALSETAAPRNPKKHGTGINQAIFEIKAGFDRPGIVIDNLPPDREHLWFETLGFDGHRVQGKLNSQPMTVPNLRRNDVTWIQRERLSDWRITIPRLQATFGPEHVKPLRQAIYTVKSMSP